MRYFKQTFVSLLGRIIETLSRNYEHRGISNFYNEKENRNIYIIGLWKLTQCLIAEQFPDEMKYFESF